MQNHKKVTLTKVLENRPLRPLFASHAPLLWVGLPANCLTFLKPIQYFSTLHTQLLILIENLKMFQKS